VSNRFRGLALTSGLIVAVLVVTAGAAVALDPGSNPRQTAPAWPHGQGDLVRLEPRIGRLLAQVPSLHGAKVRTMRHPGCRAYLPGTSRTRPIPTEYESRPRLIRSPSGLRAHPRPHPESPRSQCVAERGR
jgi:hypothetical protein